MYTVFVDNFKENNHRNPFYDTPDLFSTFGNIRDSLKPFTSKSLDPFQLLQSHFLLFLCLWPQCIPSVPLLLTNILIDFLTVFVPRPIVAVELSQNYLELPKEIFGCLFRFQIPSQCISFPSSKWFSLSSITTLGRGTKMVSTYIIPLSAMPWWLFFWKLALRDRNCQNFGGVFFFKFGT